MTIFVAVIAVLLLLAFWLLFLAVSRDNRVLTREPSELEIAARRFSESMQEMQRAFAVGLMPAFTRVTNAMNDWHASWSGVIEEVEAKHGPRPKDVPFLDWWASVESNQERKP